MTALASFCVGDRWLENSGVELFQYMFAVRANGRVRFVQGDLQGDDDRLRART